MALQINIDGLKTAKGGVDIPQPLIARFVPVPMWNTLNLRFDFKYVILENEGQYGTLESVLYEKPIQIPIYEELEEGSEETPQVIGYSDGIEKIILPSTRTKVISSLQEIYALYATIEQIMPTQSAFVKNVFGYHMMAKELLTPIFGEENIIIRLDLA